MVTRNDIIKAGKLLDSAILIDEPRMAFNVDTGCFVTNSKDKEMMDAVAKLNSTSK